ncbi:MAG: hypothetical protein AB7G37_13645 [Solirubrobacteraceae bacterium]
MTSSDPAEGPASKIDYTIHLTPFTPDELASLRRYVGRVEELSKSPFAAGADGPITLRADMTSPGVAENIQFEGPDRAAAQHVAGIFRELFHGHNATSALRVASLIGQHAKAGAPDVVVGRQGA